MGDQPVTRPLPTHRINAHRHACLEWDSSGRRRFCLRPRGRPLWWANRVLQYWNASTGAYSEEAVYVPSVYNTELNLVPLLRSALQSFICGYEDRTGWGLESRCNLWKHASSADSDSGRYVISILFSGHDGKQNCNIWDLVEPTGLFLWWEGGGGLDIWRTLRDVLDGQYHCCMKAC
jgi:hypothetical protein